MSQINMISDIPHRIRGTSGTGQNTRRLEQRPNHETTLLESPPATGDLHSATVRRRLAHQRIQSLHITQHSDKVANQPSHTLSTNYHDNPSAPRCIPLPSRPI